MATVRVVTPGLFTTVQDGGRWGWQAVGVAVAGAMDARALRLANALAGNHASAAALEVTLAGPELEFEDARKIAICGAAFAVRAGGADHETPAVLDMSPGDRLWFGARRRGGRAYVAVRGGIDVPTVFGSRSTHVQSRLGGFHGRALSPGDVLPLGDPEQAHMGRRRAWHPSAILPPLVLPGDSSRLRVLPGPHIDLFEPGTLDRIQSTAFVVGGDSDRMGCRLDGPRLAALGGEWLSRPTVAGDIQVPPGGQPIVLLADRQSTGGYPVLATVISADVGLAGQLVPGDHVTFEVCSRREALAALVSEERLLMAWEC